jgi:hypothetical protein
VAARTVLLIMRRSFEIIYEIRRERSAVPVQFVKGGE